MPHIKKILKRKQSRINAYKQLELGIIAKSIQGLKKALVNANNQAMTTVNELDAMMLEEELSGDTNAVAGTYNAQEIKNLRSAIQACENASQKIQEAVNLSDQATMALRGKLNNAEAKRTLRQNRRRNTTSRKRTKVATRKRLR